jgi:ABC-2 type transport system permease protein
MNLLNNTQAVALWTIIKKEVRRFMRIWKQTLIPPVINQSLYFLIFGAFIGGQLREINGVSYMSFIVPGLILMSIISNCFSNVVSSFYGSKFQRSLEELFVSPTKKYIILLGFTVGGMVRGLMIGMIVFAVSSLFVTPQIHSIGIVLLFALLTAMLFALGGLTMGIFAKSFDDTSFVPTFILTPLTYLGGVFYDIQTLPEIWRVLSYANPIAYMIDGFRFGFYGFSSMPVATSFVILVVLCLVFTALNLWLLKRGYALK